MINYKLTFSYNGTFFYGFQKQLNKRTVEGELFVVIKKIFNDVDTIIGSGRTDTGVHALRQVVNFKSKKSVAVNGLLYSFNRMLPSDITIMNIEIVDNNFNARRSAVSREYHYLFSPLEVPSYMKDFITKVEFNSSEDYMNKCASIFLGEHDFLNFRKKGSFEKTTKRVVTRASIKKQVLSSPYGSLNGWFFYSFQIEANSFLYRMVRNCMGALFQVFREKQTLDDLKKLLDLQKVDYRFSAAPAQGLSLINVNY